MRLPLIIILTCISVTVYGQLETLRYAGTFSYVNDKSKATGTILIYPETDSTALFYLDVNLGAPSYNMGSLYGRVKVIDGQGMHVSPDQDCQWSIQFSKGKLTIKTIKEFYDCGFGNGVVADGTFEQTSKKTPDHFETPEGKKYFFKTTTPEKYNNK